MRSPRVLLISCYELGHQPLGLAWPRAFLSEAGIRADAVDLSVDPFPNELAATAQFVGISVPMHTALRIGVEAARKIRQINPGAFICFFGLYATLNAGYLIEEALADDALSGEHESLLVQKIQAVTGEGRLPETLNLPLSPLARQQYPVPERAGLPPLSKYTRLAHNGNAVLTGYTETTRGCLHTCTHCPVVPVYGGRFFAVPAETVMADIRRQAAQGARHITFGDPDFLNGPTHALRIARTLHREFPGLTFDFTAKVEHILNYPAVLAELRSLGAVFIVSAFESLSDEVLARLEKGHTAADLDIAMGILNEIGLPVQPTWVAFTPWTKLEDFLAMLAWIRKFGMIGHVPLVQYAIRLLVPPKSRLLDSADRQNWLGALDAANFTYRWTHPDPRMDALQIEMALLAEKLAGTECYAAFDEVEAIAYSAAEQNVGPHLSVPAPPVPPRLTEDWF